MRETTAKAIVSLATFMLILLEKGKSGEKSMVNPPENARRKELAASINPAAAGKFRLFGIRVCQRD
jgi:hypothetical protein